MFVQSIQDSETLTVVPLDEQTETLQLAQPVDESDVTTVVTTAADLSTGLQVLTSVSSSLDTEQQQLSQELTVKQVEAMLNQGVFQLYKVQSKALLSSFTLLHSYMYIPLHYSLFFFGLLLLLCIIAFQRQALT